MLLTVIQLWRLVKQININRSSSQQVQLRQVVIVYHIFLVLAQTMSFAFVNLYRTNL